MGFFWRQQENIEKMLDEYFRRSDLCFELFEHGMNTFFEKGGNKEFGEEVEKIHKAESSADDLRREIEHTLYGKALLPESRGDILGLLETFDQLPNRADTIAYALRTQRITLPEAFIEDFKMLVDVNLQAYHLTRKAVDALFNNPKVALGATTEVDNKESESDRIERTIISAIFDSGMEMGQKLLIKDVVLLIGGISDRAEKTGDRISIVAIKRQI
ncbi:DUF47 family protein [Myxococcota bacterium]|nr:DUF47 family protein [Myxococcota bacterium]